MLFGHVRLSVIIHRNYASSQFGDREGTVGILLRVIYRDGIISYIYLLRVLFGLEMSVLLIITNFDGSNDRKFGRHSNLACNSCSLMNSHHVDQQAMDSST